MPAFKLSDQFGFHVDATPGPTSVIAKLFGDAGGAVATGVNLSRLGSFTLEDPAVTSVQGGLNFDEPAAMEALGAQLEVAAGVSGSVGIFVPGPGGASLFSADEYGDNITVAANERYVSIGITATVKVGGKADAGNLGLGFEPETSLAVVNYRKFSASPPAPTIVSALAATIQGFSLPLELDDLAALPSDSVVVLEGRGALHFSASANLLAAVNPLATVALPGGMGALSVKAGESFEVGADYRLSCEYQTRVQKLTPGRVRLGYYRKRGSEFSVDVTAKAGITAGLGGFDFYATLLQAISADPEADRTALQNAGLNQEQVQAIEDAVKAGVERKLEISASAELTSLDSSQAVFLYEVDLDRLDARAREAAGRALRGDLSALAETERLPAAGITPLRSISTSIRGCTETLRINLLGIYSFLSVSKLTLSGKVVYEPVTGDLVITDTATAERIQAARVPFRAESQRLRKVLAESFLITAAYRGSGCVAAAPVLKSSHTFFELHARTDRRTIEDCLEVATALGLLSPPEAGALLGTRDDFGPTTLYAETRYDDRLTTALFLDGSQPRSREEYEAAGREAIQLLVRPGDPDAFRRLPAADDVIWGRMKAAGQPGFKPLFPALTGEQVAVIAADYTVIVWWAETMRRTAEKLAAVRKFLESSGGSGKDEEPFRSLRADLARHLEQVARDTKEEFGRPWGLIAMDRVSGRAAEATVQLTGSGLALLKARGK